MLIFVRNSFGQLRHKQTLKHARKMHGAMVRATEQDNSMEVKNGNVSSGLCKGFIMNE